jgi:hypothetical protein
MPYSGPVDHLPPQARAATFSSSSCGSPRGCVAVPSPTSRGVRGPRRTPADAWPRRRCRCCVRTRSRSTPAALLAGMVLTDAIAAQRTRRGALLGDPSAVDVGVGLVVLGGQPGPAGQLRRRGEAGDVADLGDEHRPRGGSIPGTFWTAVCPGSWAMRLRTGFEVSDSWRLGDRHRAVRCGASSSTTGADAPDRAPVGRRRRGVLLGLRVGGILCWRWGWTVICSVTSAAA